MNTANPPLVSVIVPVLDGLPTFAELLDRLLAQDFPPEQWELLIVDNGSRDGSYEHALRTSQAHPGMLVLRETTRKKPAAARNAGVRASRGKILAFIDADCLPHTSWLRQLVRVFDDRTVWAAGGLVESAAPTTLTEAFTARQQILNQEDFFKERPYKPPFLLTANFAARRAVFDRIGLFDETFDISGEDADFCWRILRAGGRFELVRAAIVAHRHRSNLRAFARQMFLYGIGSATTFARHRDLIGHAIWVDLTSYRALIKALIKSFLYPVVRRDPYLRREGWLEVIRYSCFIAGRIVGSLRHKVVCV